MERNDASADPVTREALRQVVKSKPTGEAVSAEPTPEQIAKRAADDARLAEVRTELGLEPELSDRRGLGDEQRVPEGAATKYDGFGRGVLAPRSAYAYREKERGDRIQTLQKNMDWARSLGIEVPRLELPDKDAGDFEATIPYIEGDLWQAVENHYKEFGRNLVKDPEMAKLLSQFTDARRVEREARSGSFGELNDARNGPFKASVWKRARLLLGGDAIVDKGQAAIKRTDDIRKQIVSLMCERFDEAGLNRVGPKSYGIQLTVTPGSSNLRRAEEVMGINLQ